MKDIFLNTELKEYYLKDFNENVLNCENDFWDIDDGLNEILKNINVNKNIQSLYSKRYRCKSGQGLDTSNKSYLEFAFTKNIELILFREFMPKALLGFNQSLEMKCACFYTYSYPKENPNYYEEPSKIGPLGCIDNPDYFRINHIELTMISSFNERHEQFWSFLQRELSSIGL